jgi:hypothetical protein
MISEMKKIFINAALGILVLANVVKATPVTPLYLRIDFPTTIVTNPNYVANVVKMINLAGIQINTQQTFSSSGTSLQGLLGVAETAGATNVRANGFYANGGASAKWKIFMSSFLSTANSQKDNSASTNPQDHTAIKCVDQSLTTFCATDYSG